MAKTEGRGDPNIRVVRGRDRTVSIDVGGVVLPLDYITDWKIEVTDSAVDILWDRITVTFVGVVEVTNNGQ